MMMVIWVRIGKVRECASNYNVSSIMFVSGLWFC